MGIRPGAVYGLLRELRIAAEEEGPLVVEGPPALAEALRRELSRGAAPGAVRGGSPEGAEAFVCVLAGQVTEQEEERLKLAHRKRVPTVAVLAGPGLEPRVPYVLASDVVRIPAGSGFPVDEIARVAANRLGERGTSLAARVPVLRQAVCEELIETFSRRSAIIGAAVFIPGADFPVITLAQMRMVLRIAAAHGVKVDQQRLPEILGVLAGGYAFRGLARRLLGVVPVAGFAVRAAVAYAGTRALGEAAVRYFAAAAKR
jgi:uncharacterized protein (DUF697 family)